MNYVSSSMMPTFYRPGTAAVLGNRIQVPWTNDQLPLFKSKNHIKKDKQTLYEDVLSMKKMSNKFIEENTRLKTHIQKLESDLIKKEKDVDDLLNPQQRVNYHLIQALKKQIWDLKLTVAQKEEELIRVRRNIKNTKL